MYVTIIMWIGAGSQTDRAQKLQIKDTHII